MSLVNAKTVKVLVMQIALPVKAQVLVTNVMVMDI
jgi:hypothetical protein